MSNLTLTIEDQTLKRARIRAIEQGTSVNAVVRSFLESYADAGDERLAIRRFLEIADGSNAGSEGKGRNRQRQELYEERTQWPRS